MGQEADTVRVAGHREHLRRLRPPGTEQLVADTECIVGAGDQGPFRQFGECVRRPDGIQGPGESGGDRVDGGQVEPTEKDRQGREQFSLPGPKQCAGPGDHLAQPSVDVGRGVVAGDLPGHDAGAERGQPGGDHFEGQRKPVELSAQAGQRNRIPRRQTPLIPGGEPADPGGVERPGWIGCRSRCSGCRGWPAARAAGPAPRPAPTCAGWSPGTEPRGSVGSGRGPGRRPVGEPAPRRPGP